jgi:hypothetical protein
MARASLPGRLRAAMANCLPLSVNGHRATAHPCHTNRIEKKRMSVPSNGNEARIAGVTPSARESQVDRT